MFRSRRKVIFLLVLCAILPPSTEAIASVSYQELVKLTASNASSVDDFGNAVAIDGNTAVVAAWTADGATSLSGAVYVFTRNQGGSDTWGEVVRLSASDGDVYHYFGSSVAIDGDTIVVGAIRAPGVGVDTGAAYVFARNHGGPDNWGEVAKLYASDGASLDYFGDSVSIDGDTVVVGARYVPGASSQEGAAYVFRRNQVGTDAWGQVAKLTGSSSAAYSYFGQSVAVEGEAVFVGAPKDDLVYIYGQHHGGPDNWGEVAQFTGDGTGLTNYEFGSRLSVSGDTLAVASPSSIDTGAVWLFERNLGGADSWGEVQRITAPDGSVGNMYGVSVSIDNDTLVVGAARIDTAGVDAGAAYLFRRNLGGTDSWGLTQTIMSSDIASEDYFGEAVAVGGDTVLVGARADDDFGSQTGSAYIFRACGTDPGEWQQTIKRHTSDAANNDFFGGAASISDSTMIVGADADDGPGIYSGSAYIFEQNVGGADTWGEATRLVASDAGPSDRFGLSVDVSGDTAIVGAFNESSHGTNSGAAYIYQRNHGGAGVWGEVTKLVASDADIQDRFGEWVAIDGDVIVVGAPYNADAGSGTGAAYVFSRHVGGTDNWGEVVKLVASDAQGSSFFGQAVDVSDDLVFVGAPQAPTAAGNTGAIYIYSRNLGGADAWGQLTKITGNDSVSGDFFGRSLATDGATLVAGAEYDDDLGSDSGAAFIFQRNQGGADVWGQVGKLLASDGAEGDAFGYRVGLSGERAVVGAYGAAGYTGAVYVFDRNAGSADGWGQVARLDAWDAYGGGFSRSVAIHGDVIVAGAPFDSEIASSSGAVYLYERGCILYDFGDAPDPTYPTLVASDGARHVIDGVTYLGAAVDAEPDGQPNIHANGDDNDGTDDEDGISYITWPVAGQVCTIRVTASAAGFVNAWMDFNADGDWSDPGEQVFTDVAVIAGANNIDYSIPITAATGVDTYARFRFSTVGGLSFDGPASDGEVEDHKMGIVALDYGDAPDPTYPTLEVSDGARHIIANGLFLGAGVDHEADGQPSPGADGDDLGGSDDEDGVLFTTGLGRGLDASIDVTASAAGLLNAWIDFNADGDWADAGEQIFTDRAVVAGANSLTVGVPLGATLGATYARFRLDSVGSLAPSGHATDGEVEDYAIEIVEGPDLQVGMTASTEPAPSGGPLTYTVTVTNNGPLTASSVTLTDTLPAELSFVSSTPGSPDCTFAGDTLTCDLGTMAALDSTQVTIETVLLHPVWGSFSNTATVTAAELDPITANNAATVDTRIALFVDDWETGDLSAWSDSSGE